MDGSFITILRISVLGIGVSEVNEETWALPSWSSGYKEGAQ